MRYDRYNPSHNLKVVSSNLAPATKISNKIKASEHHVRGFCVSKALVHFRAL